MNDTATAILERRKEWLTMTEYEKELLDKLQGPIIDRTFNIMQEAGILPKPPDELVDTQ